MSTLTKIKTDLRISHTALDEDIQDSINACLKDLEICGVENRDETDGAILNAVKLWCRAQYSDDTNKQAMYFERYGSMKATLMMSSGYNEPEDEDDETGTTEG